MTALCPLCVDTASDRGCSGACRHTGEKTMTRPVFGSTAQLSPEPHLPPRINTMLLLYGKAEGQKCKTCIHLRKLNYSGTYYKCELSKMTHGAGTDWRVNWPACGKWEAKP